MKLFPLWFRYLFYGYIKRFALYLSGLFLLFVLFDYSLVWIKNPPASFWGNYLGLFFYRFEYFSPLAFLLALSVTSYTQRESQEQLSMEIAGISKQKLLLPALCLSIIIAGAGFVTNQWLIPNTFYLIEKKAKQKKIKDDLSFTVKPLENGEIIAYRTDDEGLQDFYWIKSTSEIWYAPLAKETDDLYSAKKAYHLEQSKSGGWDEIATVENHLFTKPSENCFVQSPSVNVLSLSNYRSALKDPVQVARLDKRILQTLFYYKLANPLSTLFLLPLFFGFFYTLAFRKELSFYLFLGLSLFLFFFSFMKACIIFSENYMIEPWVAFVALPLLVAGLGGWKLQTIR